MLPLSCQHLLAHGGSATCRSPFQSIEAKVAAAGLSHLPCPASNQGQSCCGNRYRSEISWKRTVRKRAVPMQLVFHLKCVCGMTTSCTCGRLQLAGKLDNWEAEGHFIVLQALLMPSYKIRNIWDHGFATMKKIPYHLFTVLHEGTESPKIPLSHLVQAV